MARMVESPTKATCRPASGASAGSAAGSSSAVCSANSGTRHAHGGARGSGVHASSDPARRVGHSSHPPSAPPSHGGREVGEGGEGGMLPAPSLAAESVGVTRGDAASGSVAGGGAAAPPLAAAGAWLRRRALCGSR